MTATAAQPTARALAATFERLATDGRLSLHVLRRAFPGAAPGELDRAVLALVVEGRYGLANPPSLCWLAAVQREAAVRHDGRAWHYLERVGAR